ncbi:MAG: polyphosphate kinase 1, partial [Thermoanaerobaculia bacterium]|nr:polyphosphate kinase 1 [Thermoanaerobaculia bacterium]
MTETINRSEQGTGNALSAVAADEASPFFNRELSWLEFNGRVLAEAEDPSVPLLERLKFIAIFGGNLDEFFMKRVGGLKLQQQSRPHGRSPDGRTPAQQLAEIGAWIRPRQQLQRALLLERILPELARNGLELVGFRDLQPAERAYLERFFANNVFPILTPLGLDTSHPFPFISNLSLSLAVALRSPASAEIRFARLKVPASLPRWIQLPDSLRFVPLEVVIAEFLERLFPGMELLESYPFRVTRAADVAKHEEQAEDLLESVQEDLRARRFASVVRLEVVPEMPEWMRSLLADELTVGPEDVYEVRPPLAARDLFQLAALPLPALQVPKWRPQVHPRLEVASDGREVDIFKVIRSGDLLVHHPYDAFSSSVERFLRVAAEDPAVLAIKQTLYRTSRNSPVVQSLIEAAERGKQVAVLVELKASFDEARNIEWAEALEGAGAHVAYGVLGYKTHAKVSLVVRQEPDSVRTYVHLATGNYNTDTAELYTDLGLFSCDPVLGADTAQLFN